MSSASNGRKNRPRSTGNIFQIGKPLYRDPQRRESTESTRKAQRAVADCRMVSMFAARQSPACCDKDAVITTFLFSFLGLSHACKDAQATAVNSCKKKRL